MRSEDLAWAAGLFEGEGCFCPRRPTGRRSIHLHAALASTDEDVVRRFAAIVGVGTIGEQRKRLPHHKPAWVWRANGEAVADVFDLLEPWLGERRRARYLEMLAERRAYEALHLEDNRRRGTQSAQSSRDTESGRFMPQGRLP